MATGQWVARSMTGSGDIPTNQSLPVRQVDKNAGLPAVLTGSAYNASQRSYITSPCFDFTNLPYPYIEFKVFWETEYRYDGNALEYSINNGTTWVNVGSVNEPVNCLNSNWFNYASISNMTGLGTDKEGWSGTTLPSSGLCSGGNGSGAWVKASHTLSNLAGKANVIFRFTCGAGTTCNDYDGFAVDDIKISNAPPNTVDFGTNCLSKNQLSFINLSSPCFTAYTWDFGDPASGSANAVNALNATHTFSGSGSYVVTLTASGGGGPSIAVAKNIHVMDVKAIMTNANTCTSSSNNATATANLSADVGVTGISYSWNTNPVATTPVITGLAAGTYIITVTAANACPAKDTVMNPQPLSHVINKTNGTCGNNNGIISMIESGGTKPYTYSWLPNVSLDSMAQNLASGIYIISITDRAGCKDSAHVQIANGGGVAVAIAGKTDVTCFGEKTGSATPIVGGSGGNYTYQWVSGSQVYTTPSIQNVSAGVYQLTVTDFAGCSNTTTATINEPLPISISVVAQPTTCGLKNGSAQATVTGGTAPYQYQWSSGSNADTANNLSGFILLNVTDKNSCKQTSPTIAINPSVPLSISLGKDIALCTGNQVKLFPGRFISYRWNNNSTDSFLMAAQTGNYSVSVIDAYGCKAADTVHVSAEQCRDILFPDAFSPDGNSLNDAFGPLGSLSAVSDYTFKIFNRWGQPVFTSTDPFKKWNGKLGGIEAGSGVYVWMAEYSFDGRQRRMVKGTVVLVK